MGCLANDSGFDMSAIKNEQMVITKKAHFDHRRFDSASSLPYLPLVNLTWTCRSSRVFKILARRYG